jgi:hypothetical protein
MSGEKSWISKPTLAAFSPATPFSRKNAPDWGAFQLSTMVYGCTAFIVKAIPGAAHGGY